ncbi:MAG: sugar phosphate nucleotidyltransferase [Candidatus Zixiibacteriota bacterium]
MKVIIPVAGIGTRLRPHTLTLPKPLLNVGGKTIIDYLLTPLIDINPEEVIFVIGYKGDMIKEYVNKHYSFKTTFIQQDKLLGLGYAIHMALEQVRSTPLMVILGDTIVECDLKKFINSGNYVLGLKTVNDPQRFGIVEISNGYIVNVEEKPARPKTNLAIIGLYYFKESTLLKKELVNLIDSGKTTSGEIQLTDALSAMIKGGIKFIPSEVQQWYDCGKKETMLKTNKHFLQKMPKLEKYEGADIIPPVFIAEKVQINNSIIGPDVSIAKNSRISNSIIKNSIIGENTQIENVIMEESIVGNNAVLKGGKKIVNIGDSTEINHC